MSDIPEPRQPYIWWGDGCWGLLGKPWIYKEKAGEDGYEFYILPSKEMKMRFGWKDGKPPIDRDTNLITKWYPRTDVEILDNNPSNSVVEIVTDYFGNPTALTKRTIEKNILIEDLKRENNILRAEKARIYQEYEEATSNVALKIKGDVEMAEQMKRLAARKFGEDDQEEKNE